MRLDSRSAPKLDGVGAELDRPFDDMAAGFFVAEGITKEEFDDYSDLVILKIMAELA